MQSVAKYCVNINNKPDVDEGSKKTSFFSIMHLWYIKLILIVISLMLLSYVAYIFSTHDILIIGALR